MSRFKKFPINPAGRDFVVGDIHGAYDLVINGLREASFNAQADRLFCVGDLIDRGANSARVLEFLNLPFVHAVLGNHEHMLMDFSLIQLREAASRDINGMAWLNSVSDATIVRMKEAFSQLPIAMQIQTRRGTVGILHAEVPLGMNWGAFVAAIEREDEAVTQTALWGRSRIKSGNIQGVPGIDRVFVGHTIQFGGPRRLGNVYAIDGGAVLRELGVTEGSLSVVDIISETQMLVHKTDPRPCEVFLTTGEGPFGQYARPRQAA